MKMELAGKETKAQVTTRGGGGGGEKLRGGSLPSLMLTAVNLR